jgi:hypothetical protein
VVSDLVNANVKNILPKDVIIATPFDKDGKLDPFKDFGECIFPFFGKNRHLNYHCVDSQSGYRCPIEINERRVPTKWGYCPENPDATRARMKYIPIEKAEGSKTDKDFQSGQCIFPHLVENKDHKGDGLFNKYQLNYSCHEFKEGKEENWYSWCPTKLGYDPLEYPLYPAADKLENVLLGKYKKSKLITRQTIKGKDVSEMNPAYLQTKKKGYCRLPKSMVKMPFDRDGVKEITLEDYNPQKCKNVSSKGGYSREELYLFGIDKLSIPQSQLMKGKKILDKNQLCDIVNNKIRELKTKTTITDQDRIDSYQKDLNKCEEGESKGGYYILDLREIGINYFDLDEEKSKEMSKKDLCNYIIPKIKKLKQEETELLSEEAMSMEIQKNVYPGDINKCDKEVRKGGINITKLRKIAENNFDLQVEGMKKEEICQAIEDKIEEIKNQPEEVLIDSSKKQFLPSSEKKDMFITLSDIKQLEQDD